MSEATQADSISRTTTLPATPAEVYAAWLSSAGHTAMTGGRAEIDAALGASFSCWFGYIKGRNEELVPGERIVQSWRTSDFPAEAPDSRLSITLRAIPEGTQLDLVHSDIPAGQGERYYAGWHERYFAPMARYFASPRSS